MNKLLLVLFVYFIFNSCSINKLTDINEINFRPNNAKELISIVKLNNNNLNWINLKGSVQVLHSGNEIYANINIKNRSDSLILFSATGPFGLELMRVKLTQDSIFYINRIRILGIWI